MKIYEITSFSCLESAFIFSYQNLLHLFVLWYVKLMLLFWSINRIGFFPSLFRFGLNDLCGIILSCVKCECFDRSFWINNACWWWRWQLYLCSVLDWIMRRYAGHDFSNSDAKNMLYVMGRGFLWLWTTWKWFQRGYFHFFIW